MSCRCSVSGDPDEEQRTQPVCADSDRLARIVSRHEQLQRNRAPGASGTIFRELLTFRRWRIRMRNIAHLNRIDRTSIGWQRRQPGRAVAAKWSTWLSVKIRELLTFRWRLHRFVPPVIGWSTTAVGTNSCSAAEYQV